jgi:mannose-1-phosphate guanylyltransferase/mannose-6-phosphate isomerase
MEALILAGGSGTRFWPLSRRTHPKQLLALEGETSPLQDTVHRLAPLIEPSAVWVCTTELLADRVRGALPEVAPERILAEPTGRNTAPAIGWAAHAIRAIRGDAMLAVLPADHRVERPEVLRRALERAGELAAEGRVVALGVEPRWPETGYGYLELGAEVSLGARGVKRFTEKPEAEEARRFVDSGGYLWNAGMFVFSVDVYLRQLGRFAPEIARGLEAIAAAPAGTAELYAELPSISVDYAVMEKLDDLLSVPVDCGWSDLGSWKALAEVMPTDGAGNACRGDVLAIDAADNLLFSDQGLVAALGVSGLVVVRTADAVLVAPKERAQEVRRLVEELVERRRDELL